jgi:hypothetical protein
MGCGCKQKKPVPTVLPATIVFVENGELKTRPKPPEPVPPAQQVDNLVDKLNSIHSH